MTTRTFQIATFGTFREADILIGLRRSPSHKLVLMCYDHDKNKAKFFSKRIRRIDRNIEVTICMVTRQNIIENVFENINTVVGCAVRKFQRILINVSSGDKLLSYAVFCAASMKGIETFIINSKYTSNPVFIPVLKFPYCKIITKTNLRILNSIASTGGVVYGLNRLQQISGLTKPLLSYHIHGRNDTKGLIDLGLVTVEAKKNNSIIIVKLTTIGKLFVMNHIHRCDKHLCG
jgi:hypothetical protein